MFAFAAVKSHVDVLDDDLLTHPLHGRVVNVDDLHLTFTPTVWTSNEIAEIPIAALFFGWVGNVSVYPFLEPVDVGANGVLGVFAARGHFEAITAEDAVVKQRVARHTFLTVGIDFECAVKDSQLNSHRMFGISLLVRLVARGLQTNVHHLTFFNHAV